MSDIDVLLQETRSFPPPPAFSAGAHVTDARVHDDAALDPEFFWAKEAESLDWMQPWHTVLEWT
ncbi:MAG: acetyl-coenzyme A synthetase N-terminal domain-containing protein, partial [Gemmatimonas sp.]